ncbi:MAG: hypothetical protein M3068_00670 [Gemmatimonadota bacterium]|nr:hypothetical protein [Gemmatimonadota bacterium]
MLHLDPERLAALADDEPTASEAAHLAGCATCAGEREASLALLALAARRATSDAERLTHWDALARDLRDEGLLRDDITPIRRGWTRDGLRVAAGLVLLAGAATAGRLSARYSAPSSPATAAATTVAGPTADAARLASASDSLSFRSATDALAALDQAQRQYRAAAAFLAATDSSRKSSENPERFRTRLAALDQISDAALAAVNDAPHDPIINQYYQATQTARQLTLQQLNNVLPTNVRLTAY